MRLDSENLLCRTVYLKLHRFIYRVVDKVDESWNLSFVRIVIIYRFILLSGIVDVRTGCNVR